MRRDPIWARAVAAFDSEKIAQAEDFAVELDAIAKDADLEIRRCLGAEVAADVLEFGQELRRLDAGVANSLTVGDLLRVADSREAFAALIEEKRREHFTVVE